MKYSNKYIIGLALLYNMSIANEIESNSDILHDSTGRDDLQAKISSLNNQQDNKLNNDIEDHSISQSEHQDKELINNDSCSVCYNKLLQSSQNNISKIYVEYFVYKRNLKHIRRNSRKTFNIEFANINRSSKQYNIIAPEVIDALTKLGMQYKPRYKNEFLISLNNKVYPIHEYPVGLEYRSKFKDAKDLYVLDISIYNSKTLSNELVFKSSIRYIGDEISQYKSLACLTSVFHEIFNFNELYKEPRIYIFSINTDNCKVLSKE